jgi:hypothetical protein
MALAEEIGSADTDGRKDSRSVHNDSVVLLKNTDEPLFCCAFLE